jgi:hypothetical protein
MTDRDLAQRLGRSRAAVTERRRRLGIPSFQPHRQPWTRAEEELLGTMPDRRLARRLKRSTESVAARRNSKNIPIFDPKKHVWTPDDDKLLGLRPDAQIAMLLRISESAVHHRRSRLGIPPPGAQGLARTQVRPWLPEEEALLGTVPDAEVARRLGRPHTSVSAHRRHLGIASPQQRWTAEADALLGTIPDRELAQRLGRTVKAIARRRERLRIPAGGGPAQPRQQN